MKDVRGVNGQHVGNLSFFKKSAKPFNLGLYTVNLGIYALGVYSVKYDFLGAYIRGGVYTRGRIFKTVFLSS